MIFVNLPVRDVAKATTFYEAIGFTRDPRFSNDRASAMVWSDTISFMLLGHDFYRSFVPHKDIADSGKMSEVILCLSRDSREEVDAIVEAAIAAGGAGDTGAKQDLPFMYGRNFEDLDGHVVETMWMDVDAAVAAMSGDHSA
jgi:uncharacterized protein